MRYIRISRIHL